MSSSKPTTAGTAAAAAGNLAARGAKAGARGVVTISSYVANHPAAVKIFCCCAGVTLCVLSILGLINISNDPEWSHRERLQSVYTFVFGLVIVVCDGPECVFKNCLRMHSLLFKYFNFLAHPIGRACFYFYVGSITCVLLPHDTWWKLAYLILGGSLCLLGLIMIGLHYCTCCRAQPSGSG
mmetsp:Transcript_58768/g.102842  ORF Transcript_58768/g.102842 Transcript_58768/m.102842 type:complete len:181 (-) Transcript_58768:103-645(-)